ncbi:flavin reductase family protein [Marinilactibacillus sp. Marseille-P9653]|uniref:flavin reductase family protein n=1 Tax=Marinilactibacillus sp. Marseille-P9653 TaxID=2866583 RepID=UPI001CE40968|nr:flavin reductase family protein [Marinilactibacillus sp. Marseille-P9653]
MHHFKADDLSSKQQYKFISGSVIPRPIAWVTSLNEKDGVVNAAPYSFFSAASNQLPLLTVAVLRAGDKIKDTTRNILEQKEAVVHIVNVELTKDMNETSAPLAPNETELDRTSLHLVDSQTVKVPGIKEARIRFETKLHQHIPVEDDNGQIVTDLFLLKVTDFYFDKTVFDTEKEYILPEALNPTARLSGNQYAEMGTLFSYERPTE